MKEKAKILIVEDEIFTALWISDHLKKLGYNVGEPVVTGEDAVKRAAEEQPDLIFMDIRLAGAMDGIAAAEEILSRQNIPIAFITGYSKKEIIERTKKLNPVAYLDKPLQMYEVEAVLAAVLPNADKAVTKKAKR
jgi:CheY-like chemotaxis protein